MGERAHCALFRINVNITYVRTYARYNNDDPLPHAARIRGRRLVHRALELRGEISKAATIRGAARFRGNTVCGLL